MANKTRPLVDNFGGQLGVGTTAVPSTKLQVGGHVIPDSNITYSLGTPNAYWSSSYVYQASGIHAAITNVTSSVISASRAIFTAFQFASGSNPPVPPFSESTVFYDWAEHSLAFYTDNSQVTHNIGQENLVRVFNPTVGAYPAGIPVYISLSNNVGVPQIVPAIADSMGSRFNVAGVTNGYISGSGYGYITTVGVVHSLTQSWAAGTPLWLSPYVSGTYVNSPPTGSFEKFFVGVIIQSGSILGTDLLVLPNPHAYGTNTASFAVSSSIAGTAYQASSASATFPTNQYGMAVLTASYVSASNGSFSGSFRGFLSGSATSASYIATCSVALLAYQSQTSDFALDSMYAWSSSYAQTCSVYEVNFLTSSVESSSFASQSFSASYVPLGRSIVLCAAYTPVLPGPDVAEYVIPYSPSGDGTTPVSWSVKRLTIRAQTLETSQSVVDIEKSVGTGLFSATVIGSLTLPASAYEAYSGSLPSASLVSGDKIRFNVISPGTAQNLTIITEISNA